MDEQELTRLISKTAVLMEQFDRRCGDVEARLQSLGGGIENLTRQVPAIMRQSADGSLAGLSSMVMDKIGGGLDSPVRDYQQRIANAGRELERTSSTLSGQLRQLERLHRLLLWKTTAAVGTCLALLLVGGLWLSMHYAQVIRENRLSAERLKAYNQADIAECGHGRLCAQVDLRGRRFGDRGQYLSIKSR